MQGFLKSIGYVAAFLLLALISYKVTMVYYENVGDAGENPRLSQYVDTIKSDGVADTVGKNLILAVNEDNGKIQKIVIEICNKNTGNLDYITVPNDIEFTISYDLYKKLASANGEIPQIICMKKIHQYFQGENMYQCAQLLLEDVMDISFSYYTVIPSGIYKDMFRTVKASGMQKWKAGYQKEMETLTSTEDYAAFWKKYYEKVQSNLSEDKKNTYSETYMKAVPDQVAFSIVSGEESDNGFVLSVEETNYALNKILKNEAYDLVKDEQDKDAKKKSSVGMAVEILNSTKVNGLASSYREKLVDIGVNVVGIGNYSSETLEKTKIIVAKEGYGEDLLAYFKGAEIEVGQLDQGLDICVILGATEEQ